VRFSARTIDVALASAEAGWSCCHCARPVSRARRVTGSGPSPTYISVTFLVVRASDRSNASNGRIAHRCRQNDTAGTPRRFRGELRKIPAQKHRRRRYRVGWIQGNLFDALLNLPRDGQRQQRALKVLRRRWIVEATGETVARSAGCRGTARKPRRDATYRNVLPLVGSMTTSLMERLTAKPLPAKLVQESHHPSTCRYPGRRPESPHGVDSRFQRRWCAARSVDQW